MCERGSSGTVPGPATRFAIRFQEDFEDGEPQVMQSPELQVANSSSQLPWNSMAPLSAWCAGRSPNRKSSITLGGAGSPYEIRGMDRRTEIGPRSATRKAGGVGRPRSCRDLEPLRTRADVQETTRLYEESTGTLNQRATDHDFVKGLARKNNLSFWLSATGERRFHRQRPDCGGNGPFHRVATRPEGPLPLSRNYRLRRPPASSCA